MRLLLALLLFLAPRRWYNHPRRSRSRWCAVHRANRRTAFLFSLNAGESFAKTIHAIPGVVPGGVTMRVWTSDDAPVIALRVSIPARAGVQHVYVPFALH
jgi:hypothetical protein